MIQCADRGVDMGESPAVEVEVKHYAGILRQAIRAAGFSVSEVERRLGAGPKSLRRVLGRPGALKLKHRVPRPPAIGLSAEGVFAVAAGPPPPPAPRPAPAPLPAAREPPG